MRILLMFISFFALASCSQTTQVKIATPSVEEHVVVKDSITNPVSVFYMIEAKTQENPAKAIELYEKAITVDSSNDAAHFELALLYRENLSDDAVDACLFHIEEAVKLDPSNTWYQQFYGRLLVDIGQTEKGVLVFQSLIENNKKNVSYYYDLAYSLEQAGQWTDALEAYDNIENNFGYDPQINYHKHKILMDKGEVAQGIAEIEEIVEKNPEYVSYAAYLSNFYLANFDLEKAEQYATSILTQSPKDPQGLLAKAKIDSFKPDAEGLKNSLVQFIQLNLEIDQKVQSLIPFIELSTQNSVSKTVIFETANLLAAEYPEDPKPYALLGDLHGTHGEFTQAIQAYQISVKNDDSVYYVWEQLLVLLAETGDYEQLANASKQAIANHKDEFLPYYFNGFSNYRLSRYDEAAPSLKNAINRLTNQSINLKIELYAIQGDALYQTGDYSQAFNSFEEVVKLNPDEPYTLNNYSYYLALQKEQLPKAKKMAKRAFTLNPTANTMDTYAFVLFQLNQFDEALELFKEAYEIESRSPAITEHLGDAYYKTGDIENALKYWREAYEIAENERLGEKIAKQTYIPYAF